MKLWLKIQHCKNINSVYQQNMYRPALSFYFVLLCNRQDFCVSEHLSLCRREYAFLTSQEGWGGTRSQSTYQRQFFDHLEKQEVLLESFFFHNEIVLSKQGKPSAFDRIVAETRDLCRWHKYCCWVHLQYVCTVIYMIPCPQVYTYIS